MSDWGETAEGVAEVALAALFAVAATALSVRYEILADNYRDDYNAQRNFYLNIFQQGGELPFVNEQFGIPFYAPDYIGINNVGYFPPGAWYLFNPQLASRKSALGSSVVDGYWMGYASRYTPFGVITMDTSSYSMDIASVYDDWNSYLNRYEEHKRDVLNERRWANRIGSLSYGVKEAYGIERGLATSFELFDKAQGELVSELSTIGNGLSSFAGYRQVQGALQRDLGTDLLHQGTYFLRPSDRG